MAAPNEASQPKAPVPDHIQSWWQVYHESRIHPLFDQYRAQMKEAGEEVFTYIDKVVADQQMFTSWLAEQEKKATASETASKKMLQHPLFEGFCAEVGVPPKEWGLPNADHETEVSLFEEWLAAKDLAEVLPPPPPPAPYPTDMDAMETQVIMPPPGPPSTGADDAGPEDVPSPPDTIPDSSPMEQSAVTEAKAAEAAPMPVEDVEKDTSDGEECPEEDQKEGKQDGKERPRKHNDKQNFKYPLEDPPKAVVDKVWGKVRDASPPKYEDQTGTRKSRKVPGKAKPGKEDEAAEAEEAVEADEVIEGMEKLCLETAQEEAKDEDCWWDDEERDGQEDDEHVEETTHKKKGGKNRSKDKEEEPIAKKGKKKAGEKEEEPIAKKGKNKAEEKEEEPIAKKGKKKAEEKEEEPPMAKKGKKKAEEKEEEEPIAKKGKKKAEEKEEEEPPMAKKGKRKAEEKEEEQPVAKKGKKKAEAERVMKSGPAKGMTRISKNRFRDVQGVVYQYNIPYEEGEEEALDEDAELQIDEDAAAAAEPKSSESTNGKKNPMSKAKAKAAKKTEPEAAWKSDDMIKPPDHITTNHIYSNVYRYQVFTTDSEDEDADRLEVTPITRCYDVADLFAGHRAISKAFKRDGLKAIALDIALDGRDAGWCRVTIVVFYVYWPGTAELQGQGGCVLQQVARGDGYIGYIRAGPPVSPPKASSIPAVGVMAGSGWLVPPPPARTKQEPPSTPVPDRQQALPAAPPPGQGIPTAACTALVLKKEPPVPAACKTSAPAKSPPPGVPAAPSGADAAAGAVEAPANKKAKTVSPPPKRAEKAAPATPSEPTPKTAAATPPSEPRGDGNQNLLELVGSLVTKGDEACIFLSFRATCEFLACVFICRIYIYAIPTCPQMAIIPGSYLERQSLYGQFKRQMTRAGKDVPAEIQTMWAKAVSGNCKAAKTMLFQKWLSAGKDYAQLHVRHVRTREEGKLGSHDMGASDSETFFNMWLCELQAHQAMFGAANMNNMLVNTSQKPIVNPNPAGAGAGGSESSGCLGLPPGGSSDGAAATKGSGKGKGRSKGKCIMGHIDELNNSFANLQSIRTNKDVPSSQSLAAVELARQRMEIYGIDRLEAIRDADAADEEDEDINDDCYKLELLLVPSELQRLPMWQPSELQRLPMCHVQRSILVQQLRLQAGDVDEEVVLDPEDFAELLVSNYAAGTSSAVNVQLLADRAVRWCESYGGQIAKDDLVWKMSKLGTCGQHPQNCERDLQTAIRQHGLKMGVQIDLVPVRMFNPSTEEIFEFKLPCICPVSLATAIWMEGAEIFESLFMGAAGKAGARKFWRNAKANASWFRDSVLPEESYEGLLPVFLYGDDVDAYRNSDPGAVSAIGWGCDFGYKRESLLQNFLLCVYAEYTACEYTHDDIMLYACEKFKHMADERINHPWHSGGYRFQLCSCRGDLKWINAKFKIHHYMRHKDEFCSMCSACKKHDDVRHTFTDFRDGSVHKQNRLSNDEYMQSKPLEDLPIPLVNGGVHLSRFLHDTTHSQLLGTSKVLNGSVLTYLIEAGEFGTFPRMGFYEHGLQSLCRPAYLRFKAWLKRYKLQATQPRFTAARLNRKHRGMYPCLASKAINGKRVTFWLASVCRQRLERANATELDELICTCIWSYCAMLQMFDVCEMVMTDAEAATLHRHGSLHLLSYAYLRKLSSRSVGKEFLRSSFCILPKHHFLQHALDEARASLINPGTNNLLAAESWVGTVGRISRKVHRRKVSARTVERYLCVLRLRLTRYEKRMQSV
ncbi:hypothetical protein AK812_SmicGene122 [Symbiodinium microadriaticum]|uniref:Uncharacterized protein n=1 Tax=Symbiodinium microadriaticum TaxID=2951 RepID=A0A1Q9F7T3_SYMMI|nr:hypothetical protein AK812_SmicGene122 [Symbiodinium microadriaticum]